MPYTFLDKHSMLKRMYSFALRLVNVALPKCCTLCHQTIKNHNHQTNIWLCKQCQPYLDTLRLNHACEQCAIPLEEANTPIKTARGNNQSIYSENKKDKSKDGENKNNKSMNGANKHSDSQHAALCASCLKFPPTYDAIKCLYLYGYPLDSIINSCKEKNQPAIAQHLGHELANAFFKHTILTSNTLITSVPIHPTKWLSRQYNPAHIMALSVIKSMINNVKKSSVKNAINSTQEKIAPLTKDIMRCYQPNLLIKNKITHTQKGLSRKARLKNLEHSMSINRQKNIKDKHIIVIDDVVTTTATAHIISSLLKNNGAKTVIFYAVARTPKS